MTRQLVEDLVAARALIEAGWTQGAGHRPAIPYLRRPDRYCVLGALRAATAPDSRERDYIIDELGFPAANHRHAAINEVVKRALPVEITQWNDRKGRTKGDVLALFDALIQEARAWEVTNNEEER